MKDDFLRLGFEVEGVYPALNTSQVRNHDTIRWIKNRGARLKCSATGIGEHCENWLRDTPVLIVRRRSWDRQLVEAKLPTYRVLGCCHHWYEDFFQLCPMNETPRLPRKEAQLRVWTIGTILRAEVLHRRMLERKRSK